jgi:hypothetical protein
MSPLHGAAYIYFIRSNIDTTEVANGAHKTGEDAHSKELESLELDNELNQLGLSK